MTALCGEGQIIYRLSLLKLLLLHGAGLFTPLIVLASVVAQCLMSPGPSEVIW